MHKDDHNERRRRSAHEILKRCSIQQIRDKGLKNMDRWQSNGVWVSAMDEWRAILQDGSDADVVAVMTGIDERSVRLRQSAPFSGLLDEETRLRIWHEVSNEAKARHATPG
jgi:hypothetical protein